MADWTGHVLDATAQEVVALVAGDVDRDGDADVIQADADGEIRIVLGLGGLATGPATLVSPAGPAVTDLVLADLDGDALLDLLVATVDSPTRVLLGLGGTFGPPIDLLPGALAGEATGLAVGDLDGDGDPDVAEATDAGDGLAWFERRADGSWAKSAPLSDDGYHDAAIGDVDGDGDLDLLCNIGLSVSWYGDPGDGVFVLVDAVGETAEDSTWLTVADLDRDGTDDAVWRTEDGVAWWPATALDGIPLLTGTEVHAVVVGDLDGDLVPDVVVAGAADPAWLRGLGGGVVDVPEPLDAGGTSPGAVALADLDGDGDLDVLVAPRVPGPTVWLENPNGPGLPAAPATDLDHDLASDVTEASIGTDPSAWDTDRDGLADGYEASTVGTDPLVADSDGDGVGDGFEIECEADPLSALDRDPDCDGLDDTEEAAAGTDPVDADTDDDGLLDGVERAGVTDPLDADSDDGGTVDGDEVRDGRDPLLAEDDWPQTAISTDTTARHVAVADVDGDGDPDVLVAFLDRVGLFENVDGTFGAERTLATDAEPTWIVAADVDGDGDPDVVVNHMDADRIDWLENVAATFSAPMEVGEFDSPWQLTATDFDGDGASEVVVGSSSWGSLGVSVFGYAGGTWVGEVVADLGLVLGVAAGDVDGDGDPDLVVANGEVLWVANDGGMLGEAAPLLGAAGDYWSAYYEAPLRAGLVDVDGDGLLDVVAFRTGTLYDVAWTRSEGGGIFAPAAPVAHPSLFADGVTGDDLDLDCDGDVVVFGEGLDWFATDEGATGFERRPLLPWAREVWDLGLVDIDLDRVVDLVTVTDEGVSWYRNVTTTGGAQRPCGDPEPDTDVGTTPTTETETEGARRAAPRDHACGCRSSSSGAAWPALALLAACGRRGRPTRAAPTRT